MKPAIAGQVQRKVAAVESVALDVSWRWILSAQAASTLSLTLPQSWGRVISWSDLGREVGKIVVRFGRADCAYARATWSGLTKAWPRATSAVATWSWQKSLCVLGSVRQP